MKLASLFSDHAVLQREMQLPVWGWAEPGSLVTVELAGKSAIATAGADGKWLAKLLPLPAGGPHTLVAKTQGAAPVVVNDVLIGEVWLCSGQSNMELQLPGAINGKEEVAAANHPRLRLFLVPLASDVVSSEEIPSQWEVCTPESAANFSAVGYFHGLELQRRLGVPVGLIGSSRGGTMAEAWTSREGLAAEPTLLPIAEESDRLFASEPEAVKDLCKDFSDQELAVKRPVPATNKGFEQGWANLEAGEGWETIQAPGTWQGAGLSFSGVVWYRREVEIPGGWAGQDLTLSIGACDKSEWTYFNGEPVGSLTMQDNPSAWSTQRVYTVPGRLVKAGKAAIAVRIYSNIYNGGMTGPEHGMFLKPVAAPKSAAIALAGAWSYQVEHNFGPHTLVAPCALFNGMIAPLIPYALRGVAWYQGESNADHPFRYRKLFPALIRDWRRRWGQEHLHFHYVQIANYTDQPEQPGESQWAELREAQTMALSLPDTGMAVIIDIGEAANIHPLNKQDVGRRLAASVLSKVHGLADVTASGPLYKSSQAEGLQIRILFSDVDGGLEARGGALKAFAIAGEDRKFVWADAEIDGETVVVSSSFVNAPVAVRYGWADNPPCNLYNKAGLPASPFRTDDWSKGSAHAGACAISLK